MSDQTSIDALQRELAELEMQLAAIGQQRKAQEQAVVAELEREREAYRLEQEELARKQAAIIERGRRDPFWWVDSHFGMDG